jgi:hypothetical protein
LGNDDKSSTGEACDLIKESLGHSAWGDWTSRPIILLNVTRSDTRNQFLKEWRKSFHIFLEGTAFAIRHSSARTPATTYTHLLSASDQNGRLLHANTACDVPMRFDDDDPESYADHLPYLEK